MRETDRAHSEPATDPSAHAPFITITELSRRTGLASSALRFYERKGLLRPVGRSGGRRIYDVSAIRLVAQIDLMKIAGFTLSEIAAMAHVDGSIVVNWRDHARTKRDELAARRAELEQAEAMLGHYIDCPADRLEDCPVHRAILDSHADRIGRA